MGSAQRQRRAVSGGPRSRRRCGRGEPGPGANLARMSPVPAQMWQGVHGPGADVAGVGPGPGADVAGVESHAACATERSRRLTRRDMRSEIVTAAMCAHAACTHDGMHAACMVRHERRGDDGRARGCDRADRVDEWWLRRAVVRVQCRPAGAVTSPPACPMRDEASSGRARRTRPCWLGAAAHGRLRCAWHGAHADGGRYGPGSREYSRVLYYTHALAHRHARRHRRVHARTRIVRCMNDGGFGSASPAGGARGRAADTSPGTRRASAQRKSRAHPRRPDLHTEQTGPRRPYLTRSAALLPCCNTGAARAVVGAALT